MTGAGTDGCAWVKPIYISKQDVLTDQTAKDILSHNKSWKANCAR